MLTIHEEQQFIKDFLEWAKENTGTATVVDAHGNAFGVLNIDGVYSFKVERFENAMMDIRVYKRNKSHYIHTDIRNFYYRLRDKDDVFEWLVEEYKKREERQEVEKQKRKHELEEKFGYLNKMRRFYEQY